jgi:hypothetical protein
MGMTITAMPTKIILPQSRKQANSDQREDHKLYVFSRQGTRATKWPLRA